MTAPYRRGFEPREAGRESLPYDELVVSSGEPDTLDTTIPKRKLDISEDKTLQKPKPELDDAASDALETIEQPKVDLDSILREIKPPVLANGSGEVAAIDEDGDTVPPTTRSSQLSFLGVATAQPQIGACLVVGARTRKDFCVTSPVTHVWSREGGTLVQTATKSRYFIKPTGDAFLVRKP